MSRRQTKTKDQPSGAQSDRRSLEARLFPFAIPHGLAAADLLAGIAAHSAWGGDGLWTPLTTLAMMTGTAGLAALAHRIGRLRESVVRWHTTATVALAGTGITLTTIIGPDIVWLQVAGGVGALAAFTWNLRRLDSLRHDTAAQAEQDPWARQLGLGNARPGKVKELGARREITVHHGLGDTAKTIQQALPAIESAAGVIPGRSRLVPDPDRADRSTLVLITEDLLKSTIPWPGPSSPGGCITDPIISGVYEDDLPAQWWLPGIPGRAPTNIMRMGMTRAGKTQEALIATANIMTRTNVVIWWADATKGAQTAGPIESGLDWYAESVAGAKAMFKAAKEVVRARADALGNAGYRQWEPECFTDPRLRMPYLVIHIEEADEIVADNDTFTWLTGKALSAGVSISVSLQRADYASMPTTARFNVGGSLCFGVGDDYSASFALSDATISAGAHPELWGNRKQGYFYLEAPGVDETRFPVPARAYYADDATIAAVVTEWAPVRARLDLISATAAGDIYRDRKSREMAQGTPPTRSNVRPSRDNEPDISQDDEELQIPSQPDAELLVGADASTPLAPHTGPDLVFGNPKPKADSPAAAAAEFDRVLAALAAEGHTEVRVRQIVERLAIRSDTWVSRRLSAVIEGRATVPPGLVLERTDEAGCYRLQVLARTSA